MPSTTTGSSAALELARRARGGARASTASATSSSSRTSSASGAAARRRARARSGRRRARSSSVGLLLDVGEQPRALGRRRARSARPAPRCSCAGDVIGVRSSCEASATSWRWAAIEPSSVSSIALKCVGQLADLVLARRPRSGARGPRSAAMWRAASVTRATGATTLRAASRPSSDGERDAAEHERAAGPAAAARAPSRSTRASGRAARAPPSRSGDGEHAHVRRRRRRRRRGTRSRRRRPPRARGRRPAAAPRSRRRAGRDDCPCRRATSWMYGVGPPRAARAARRSPAAAGARSRAARPPVGALHELRLLEQLVVDLRAQLAAHGAVGDRRDEHHRHGHRERGRHGHAAAQRHQRLSQDVADAAHRVQQARLAARLGLAAQVAHVDAERVRARAEVVAPDALEDLRARQHLARVLEEQRQQLELGARELEPARARGAPPRRRGRATRSAKRSSCAVLAGARRGAAARAAAP